jgi:hypothetical protein
MDNQETSMPSRKHGIVINFPSLSERLLYNMRLDVGLFMKVDFLRFLQQHYKNVEKRDPSLDELYFIDRYLEIKGYGASPVGEMIADTEYAAETYSDLISKWKAVCRHEYAPSLGEVAGVAGRYLERSGRISPLDSYASVAAGDAADLRLILSGFMPCALTDDGAAGRLCRREALVAPAAGSLIVILHPASEEMPPDAFARALSRTVFSKGGQAFRRGVFIGETGIAGAIPDLCGGASIDLDAVPGVAAGSGLTGLCDAAHGSVVAALDQYAYKEFAAAAGAESIAVNIIGSVSSSNSLSVTSGGTLPLSMNIKMEFLRALARHTGEKFIIRRHTRNEEESICAGRDITGGANLRCFDAGSELLLATVRADGRAEPFFMSLGAVLTAAAQCVAGGADYTDAVLSFCAEMPAGEKDESGLFDPYQAGDALALILGAYRAQMEYCLPDTGSVYTFSGNRPDFSFTVSASARIKGKPVPAVFCKAGSGVYLLAPHYDSYGMPDFEDLRRLWRYAAAVCRDGLAKSAFAAGPGSVNDAIMAMCGGGNICFDISGNVDGRILSTSAPGGIIIESDAQLQGMLIGHTEAAIRFSGI